MLDFGFGFDWFCFEGFVFWVCLSLMCTTCVGGFRVFGFVWGVLLGSWLIVMLDFIRFFA